VPFVYAIGNHDLETAWIEQASRFLPARRHGVQLLHLGGVDVVALDWPGADKRRTRAQDRIAWSDAIGLRLTTLLQRRSPLVVVSHVAPHGAGDRRDVYHQGFGGYRWLAEQLRPALWLHGHTTPASQPQRVTTIGPTTCVNVTGAWLIDLAPAGAPRAEEDPTDRVEADARAETRRAETIAARPR
jgi:Icc-related predicted phosphoesterase